MKKILIMLVTVVILISMSISTFAYTDTNDSDYILAITNLSDWGIVNGYEDGSFKPNKPVTRAEMSKMLTICLGLESGASLLQGSSTFDDVLPSHWATGYIAVAVQYGLIKGDGNGNFRPDDNVSYAETVTMILRGMGYSKEIEKVGEWPENYLKKAREINLFKNITTSFENTDKATRGTVAQMVWNMITFNPNDENIVNEKKQITDVYACLYKKSSSEYHLVFNTTGNISPDYTEKQLVSKSQNINNGIKNEYPNSDKITKVIIEEEIIPKNTTKYFCGLTALKQIENIENINTSNANSMYAMFEQCESLKELDLSTFDTSNVTDMRFMFSHCYNLRKIDLSGFNTAKVTNMNNMFCACSELQNIDLSNFDTSNVITMTCMFARCESLEKLDLNNFNTKNVRSMMQTFERCSSLKELEVSNWDVSSVQNMGAIFDGCDKLSNIPDWFYY